MHSEYYEINQETVDKIAQRAKEEGGRVIAVGTTAVRTLRVGIFGRQAYKSKKRYRDFYLSRL